MGDKKRRDTAPPGLGIPAKMSSMMDVMGKAMGQLERQQSSKKSLLQLQGVERTEEGGGGQDTAARSAAPVPPGPARETGGPSTGPQEPTTSTW